MKNSKAGLMIAGLLCATVVSPTMLGCGQGAPPAVKQATQSQVDNVVKMRELYVKAKGNYDSLSAEEKTTYNQLAGGEAAGQAQWKEMGKSPAAGSPVVSGGDPRAGSGQ